MTGHIRKRGRKSWEVRIETGKDSNGNREFDYVTVHGTENDAQKELTRRMNDLNNGAYVDSTKITVAEFLDRWLSTYAECNVGAKTLEGYKSIIEQHFKPSFGSLPLQKLTAFQIQSHYAKLLKEGGRKDGRKGGLSRTTVLHQHRLLSEALAMAVQWQLLARNICDAVTPPNADPREVQVIDEIETAWLIEAAQGTRLYLPIFLTTCAGLRRGEILGAVWSNVDQHDGTLRIDRALSEPRRRASSSKGPRASVLAPSHFLRCWSKH